MKLYTNILLLVICAIQLQAQSPAQLLKLGRKSYDYDQGDSAKYYYSKAYEITDSNIKLGAITGLTRIALLAADLPAADSLIKLGEKLQIEKLDRKIVLPFEIVKGVYFKKNSDFKTALAIHKKAVAKSANWQDGIVIYADALFQTALTFERLSKYDSSIAYVDKAYALYQQNLEATSIRFAEIYNGLGVCYYRANDFQKSKEFYLKSKWVCEEKLGPLSSDLALCLSNLANISRAEENYQEAIDYSEASLKIFTAINDKEGVSGAYYSLGVYYYFLQ
jgi:tetratricopeptide (TPR) repeat protein